MNTKMVGFGQKVYYFILITTQIWYEENILFRWPKLDDQVRDDCLQPYPRWCNRDRMSPYRQSGFIHGHWFWCQRLQGRVMKSFSRWLLQVHISFEGRWDRWRILMLTIGAI